MVDNQKAQSGGPEDIVNEPGSMRMWCTECNNRSFTCEGYSCPEGDHSLNNHTAIGNYRSRVELIIYNYLKSIK